MPLSQAGLEKTFFLRFSTCSNPLRMRTAAVLLLIISLSAAVVQAAALPTHLATSAVAISAHDVSSGTQGHHNAEGCTASRTAFDMLQSKSDPNALYNGHLGHHVPIHSAAPPLLCPPELSTRGIAETVILVRRMSVGAKIRAAFHKFGQKVKHAFQKAGHAIKHAFQKVGHAIKTAAQKVGHFIKTTGAKIAKVALKIVATVGKVVSKVVGFLPGVGKVVGKAIEGASEGLNKASDAIHAHIGGKLGKAMHNMDKAQHIVGKIP
ncbi:hypothetical protein D9619_011089 [Psilocybe cf. subviscida]|uniref:Uncharacterized protein n=1 Tax=Psilocybe cf. subviscida TaxID=2480587 RepID=A0A8H5F5U6_9AGAR|nr:hypothetical protein D9619_011089 [Psilocybe cf. subviscida]